MELEFLSSQTRALLQDVVDAWPPLSEDSGNTVPLRDMLTGHKECETKMLAFLNAVDKDIAAAEENGQTISSKVKGQCDRNRFLIVRLRQLKQKMEGSMVNLTDSVAQLNLNGDADTAAAAVKVEGGKKKKGGRNKNRKR